MRASSPLADTNSRNACAVVAKPPGTRMPAAARALIISPSEAFLPPTRSRSAMRRSLSQTALISSRRRHTSSLCDWSSDVCSSDLERPHRGGERRHADGETGERFSGDRSEERRVGKECRYRRAGWHRRCCRCRGCSETSPAGQRTRLRANPPLWPRNARQMTHHLRLSAQDLDNMTLSLFQRLQGKAL